MKRPRNDQGHGRLLPGAGPVVIPEGSVVGCLRVVREVEPRVYRRTRRRPRDAEVQRVRFFLVECVRCRATHETAITNLYASRHPRGRLLGCRECAREARAGASCVGRAHDGTWTPGARWILP